MCKAPWDPSIVWIGFQMRLNAVLAISPGLAPGGLAAMFPLGPRGWKKFKNRKRFETL